MTRTTTINRETDLMLWVVRKTSCLALTAVMLLVFSPLGLLAEEVIIEEGYASNKVDVGDYSCSPCAAKLSSTAFNFKEVSDFNTIEMTAGELWEFFDGHGYDSVNKLTLFVDVDQLGYKDSLNLSKLNIQIQSPDGNLATDTNLGSDRLVVPGAETSPNRPEAELRFDLGYDFMKLFSRDSTEVVRVSIESPMGASIASPRFHLAAERNVFASTHLPTMFLFVLFWGTVFLVLLRCMKPSRKLHPARIPTIASSQHGNA